VGKVSILVGGWELLRDDILKFAGHIKVRHFFISVIYYYNTDCLTCRNIMIERLIFRSSLTSSMIKLWLI
jgi:hypothetical protein